MATGRTYQGWLFPALQICLPPSWVLLCVPEAETLTAWPRPSGFGLPRRRPIRRGERPRQDRSEFFLPVPSMLQSRVPTMAMSPSHGSPWRHLPWLTGLLPSCPEVALVLGAPTALADILHPACASVISPSLEPSGVSSLSCQDPI